MTEKLNSTPNSKETWNNNIPVSLRLPKQLREKIREKAISEWLSQHSYVRWVLNKSVKEDIEN